VGYAKSDIERRAELSALRIAHAPKDSPPRQPYRPAILGMLSLSELHRHAELESGESVQTTAGGPKQPDFAIS